MVQYDQIRGMPGSFRKLEDAFAALALVKRDRKIDAYVNFTLMKDNISLFKEVKKFADFAGLPVAICLLDKTSAIFKLGDNENKFWINDPENMKRLAGLLEYLEGEMTRKRSSLILNYPALDFIAGYFTDPRQAAIPCVVSQDRIYVDPYGNVFGGCLSMGTFGNLKDIKFSDLKKTECYRTAKKNMFYKKCAGCSCGYLFNIKHMPGLIIKDLFERIQRAFKR